MYKLLQNQVLRQNHKEINRLGLDAAINTIPGVDTHMRCSMSGASKFIPDDIPFYTHVADIEATELDEAFGIHNGPIEDKITRYGRQHSMSVGDILVQDDGHLYMCDPYGWTYIGNSNDYPSFPSTYS